MTQPEKIEHILNGGCEYFGITREELTKKTGSHSSIWNKKLYLVMVLYDYTVCNMTDIATYLGYSSHNTVSYHLKIKKEELSEKMYGSDKTKRVYFELLKYLEL